jgi:hypothetical protein
MTDDDLQSRLAETLIAANRRWRKSFPFGAACVIPAFPDALIQQVARGLAPLLRELVREAVADQQAVVLRDSPGAALSAAAVVAHRARMQP